MKVVSSNVRGIKLRLVAYTRALELCARMNRELEVLDFIDEIEVGAALYDIGACEGRFAIYAALRGVRCWACEPEMLNFQALMQNIGLNGDMAHRFVTPLQYAIGETRHTGKLKIAQPWAGGHQRVVADSGRVDLALSFSSEQDVDVVALDELIPAQNLPQPNYLKIDVDGSELPLVKGAMDTLRSSDLRGLMFELHVQDGNYQKIIRLLRACGFDLFGQYEIETGLFNFWFKRRH